MIRQIKKTTGADPVVVNRNIPFILKWIEKQPDFLYITGMTHVKSICFIPAGQEAPLEAVIKKWSGDKDLPYSVSESFVVCKRTADLCLTIMSGEYFMTHQSVINNRINKNSSIILITGRVFTPEEKSQFHANGMDFIETGNCIGDQNRQRDFLISLSFYFDRYQMILTLRNKINNYITESFQIVVANMKLDQANKEINELNDRLKISSRTDFLTHLLNRRAMYDLIGIEIRRSRQVASDISYFMADPRPQKKMVSAESAFKENRSLNDYVGVFTIALCDIDHFKQINDTYGHLEGDNALRMFGSLLSDKTIFRPADICGRYGGEEFLLLFPDTSMRNARFPLEKLMTAVRDMKIPTDKGATMSLTVSIGVTELSPTDLTVDAIIKRADDALYEAKATGRNKIVYDPPIKE